MQSTCHSLPLCCNYLEYPSESDEELILDTISLDTQMIALTLNEGSPAIQIKGETTSSLKEALKIITSIPNLQKKLLENNACILNGIALITNHLCNNEAKLYHFVQNSALFKPSLRNDYSSDSYISYQAESGFERYMITFSLMNQGKVSYTLMAS